MEPRNLLQEEQVQHNSLINTYYTQYITAYGDGFFDLGSIEQKNSVYDSDAFNAFIEDIKNNINNIYEYNFLADNPQAAIEFLANCETIKLKYETTFGIRQ